MAWRTVLVVEDDSGVRSYLRRALRLGGFSVEEAADGESGLRLALERDPCAVVLDYNLPVRDGLEVLDGLRQAGKRVPVLILTGRDEPGLEQRALEAGARGFLTKPVGLDELLRRVGELAQGAA